MCCVLGVGRMPARCRTEHSNNIESAILAEASCQRLPRVHAKVTGSFMHVRVLSFPPQAAAGEAVGLSAADVAQIAAERRLQAQQRFMAGWLKLQNEVNALIDSTAADNSDQSVRAQSWCRVL